MSEKVENLMKDEEIREEKSPILHLDEVIDELEVLIDEVHDDHEEVGEIDTSMSASSSPPQTATKTTININYDELPPQMIRLAISEELERLKILNSVASFVEDISENFNIYGRNLIKIGQPLFTARSDWLPMFTMTLEGIFRVNTITHASNLASLSQNLNSNICKLYPEHAKNLRRSVTAAQTRLHNLQDEIRRAKIAHDKTLKRYGQLILDVQSQWKQRLEFNDSLQSESALLAAVNSPNGQFSPPNSNDPMSPDSAMETSMSVASGPGTAGGKSSFTKMFGKMTPVRRVFEKCRDLTRELDSVEIQLINEVHGLNVLRRQLLTESVRTYRELGNVENDRISKLHDGVERFLIALELSITKQSQTLESAVHLFSHSVPSMPAVEQGVSGGIIEKVLTPRSFKANLDKDGNKQSFEAFEGKSEFDQMCSRIETLSQSVTSSSLSFMTNVLNIANEEGLNTVNHCVAVVFSRSERLIEALDHIQSLATHCYASFGSLCEVDGAYSNNIEKMLEKHGFPPSATKNTYPLPGTCGALIKSFEMPTTSSVWNEIIVYFQKLCEAQNLAKDHCSDQFCAKMNALQGTINAIRLQLIDCISENTKEIEQSAAALSKGHAKLAKIRNILRDRRAQVRGNEGLDGGSVHSVDDDSVVTSTSLNSPPPAQAGGIGFNLSQKFESFGSNLRSGKIKQAVGLERASERKTRVENEIASLAEDEKDCLTECAVLTSTLSAVLRGCREEVDSFYNNTIVYAQSSLGSLQSLIQSCLEWNRERLSLLAEAVAATRKAFAASDMHSDVMYCINDIKKRNETVKHSLLMDIPEPFGFDPISSNSVCECRRYFAEELNISPDSPQAVPRGSVGNALDESQESDANSPEGDQPSRAEDVLGRNLSKFGLTNNDQIIESYSCAIYPKKGMLTHGRMFITQNYVAFSGWPETRVLLPMCDIVRVEKSATLVYIQNAVSIHMRDGSDYFFGSYVDRDQCFKTISSLSEVARRLLEMHGTADYEGRNLELGIQIITSAASALFNRGTAPQSPATTAATPTTTPRQNILEELAAKDFDGHHSEDEDSDEEEETVVEVDDEPLPVTFDLESIFKGGNIVLLHEETFNCDAKTFFRALWGSFSAYKMFVEEEGDFEVKHTEWVPYPSKQVVEDVAKIPFTACREQSFLHPRTTMLMFGPKNAPAKQTQYLYLPTKHAEGNGTMSELKKCQPNRGVVLLLTQFDGIPMADVFKVMQYFSFEEKSGANGKQVHLKVGLNIHYVKYTMLKGQIIQGTKEEMIPAVKRQCAFSAKMVEDYIRTGGRVPKAQKVSTLTATSDQAAVPIDGSSTVSKESSTQDDIFTFSVNIYGVDIPFWILLTMLLVLAMLLQRLSLWYLKNELTDLHKSMQELRDLNIKQSAFLEALEMLHNAQ